jgi:formylmethanofuran dehydrogenase subunit B
VTERSLDVAVEAAVDLLAGLRFPLVFGLSRSTVEAQRAAVEAAELLGGALDVAGPWGSREPAFEHVGALTASFGDVHSRADVVLFWGCSPQEGGAGPAPHRPRVGGRRLLVSIGEPSPSSGAEAALSLDPSQELSGLVALRAFVRGRRVEEELAHGLPLPALKSLAQTLRGASYAVIVHDARDPEIVEALARLARDASRNTRTRLVPAATPGNALGAANVLSWQTGFPGAVSFASGVPAYGPGEFSAEALLARPDVDGALLVGCDPAIDLSPQASRSLDAIPLVRVGGAPQSRGLSFSTAALEVTPGTVFRSDGIALRQRRPRPGLPTEAEVLSAIVTGLSRRRLG